MVEVVVSIALLALLFSLVLPAVARARRTADRLNCQNHMRQLGLACQNYLEVWSVFPRPSLIRDDRTFDALLPMLELPPLTVRKRADRDLAVFTCPSDPDTGPRDGYLNMRWNDGVGTVGSLAGISNYSKDRPVGASSLVRPVDIIDGLSSTALLSERLLLFPRRIAGHDRPSTTIDTTREPLRFLWYLDRKYDVLDEFEAFLDGCRDSRVGATPHPFVRSGRGRWETPAQYDHALPPNSPGCLTGDRPQTELEYIQFMIRAVRPASSLHDGGVNAAICDGSVRFVSQSIDRDVWQAVGTRAGQEMKSLQ